MSAKILRRLGPIIILLTLFHKPAIAQTVSVSSTFTDTQLCIEQTFIVPLAVTGTFDDTNVFSIEMSNATGSFSSPTVIGFAYGAGGGATNATCTLPATITPGTGYRIRITANHPAHTSGPNAKNIRVSAYPTLNIAPVSSICFGSTISLSASSSNPNPTFTWTGPGAWSSSGATVSRSNATYSDSGYYHTTVTSYKCSTTDSVKVNVLPQPVFSGWETDTMACEGQIFNIKPLCNVCSLPAGQVKYSWKYPPVGTSSQSFINLLAAKTDNNGWFKLTISIGTCSTTDSFYATIKPLPDTPTATNNGPLCEGEQLNLYGNSTTTPVTYRWEGPNGFSSIQQNPSINNAVKANEGDYYVYVTHNECESKPYKTNVRIGIPLIPLVITGDTVLCPGEMLRLSAQTNIATGIEWRKLPADSIIVSTTRTLGKTSASASDAGRYYVTQEVAGCKSPPSYINVIIPDIKHPKADNNGPLCLEDTLELTAIETVGGTYTWTGPNGFTSNQQSPTISNIDQNAAGKYRITTVLEFCTETDSTIVEIKPKPQVTGISSNSPVCTEMPLNLFGESSIANAKYEWIGPDNFTSDKQSPVIILTPGKEGTYTLRVIVDECYSDPATTTVELREGPGAGKARNNSPISEGEALELYANNTKDSVIFYWEGPDGFTSNEQNPIIPIATIGNRGEYKLMSIYNSCTTITTTIVDIKDILGITVELYPNPNEGRFKIKGIAQTNEVIRLNIYSHLGMLVYTGEIIPDNLKFEGDIDLEGASSGVYILRLVSGTEKRNIRFTVVRQ